MKYNETTKKGPHMPTHTRSGFILIFSLMMIMFFSFMAIYLADRGGAFLPYARTAYELKQAHVLAQTGIQLGLSQLTAPKSDKKNESKDQKKPSAQEKAIAQLTVILPSLNRWQTVEFDLVRDGIEGTVAWCIVSEQGKIDLNAWYDFNKHEFIQPKEAEPLFKYVFEKIEQQTGAKDLYGAFVRFMKDREYPLNDATELLTQPFVLFNNALFYDPDMKHNKKFYLTDIFTVWTGAKTVNPWLLSASMQAVFGCAGGQEDSAARKKMVAEWLKPFKLKVQWQTEWDKILKPLYKKEFASIPKSLQPLLSSTYEAQVFSILATATVGRATERLLAIVELKDGAMPITKKVYKL